MPRGTSYGENIKALSLSLLNEANTPINKVVSTIKGISNDEIIKKGYKENNSVDKKYILNKQDEYKLISRLEKYKENHLMFLLDFDIGFTNNTSEKGLRQTKRKLAVSFMFKNSNRMKDYATILSYLETCNRHGISRYNAAKRLVSGNPYMIDEIKNVEN